MRITIIFMLVLRRQKTARTILFHHNLPPVAVDDITASGRRSAMKVERRQHRRYPLPVDEMFVLGRYSNNVATVRDIGEGGLKFEYPTGNFAADQWSLVDIVAGRRDRVLVSAVRCEICYDIGNLLENGTFTGKEVRSCGLRFVALTDDQIKSLHRFVARCDVYNGDWT